jgi:hypothetical protein
MKINIAGTKHLSSMLEKGEASMPVRTQIAPSVSDILLLICNSIRDFTVTICILLFGSW